MERELKKVRNIVNRIVKNLGRADIDWVVQVSITSVRPDKLNYCVQIEAPANGLAPITWVKDTWEELEEALKKAEKELDKEAVEKAYLASQIKAAEEKKSFFEEKLMELEKNEINEEEPKDVA